jgi:recombination protein RecT
MSDNLPALIEEMNVRIGKHTAEFEAALPKGVTVAQLKQDALNSLRATPKLAQAHGPTVLGALMTCAQLGLRPGVSGLGHAWLLPFKNWKEGNRLDAQLIIGYRGYVDLVSIPSKCGDGPMPQQSSAGPLMLAASRSSAARM